MASETPKGRKVSAYFAYCKEHREEVKARLKAAGQSITAPSLTKALSEQWRALSDEEKQKYKSVDGTASASATPVGSKTRSKGKQAAAKPVEVTRDESKTDEEKKSEDKEESARNADVEDKEGSAGFIDAGAGEAAPASKGATSTEGDEATENGIDKERKDEDEATHPEEKECVAGNADDIAGSHSSIFPLARVKRIIKLDKEIRVVAADATNLISLATRHFLELLAESAYNAALKQKHKTIRLDDLKNAIKAQPRIHEFLAEALNDALHDGGLDDDSDSGDEADEQHAAQGQSNVPNKRQKVAKKSLPEPPAGTRKIADFFGSKSAPADEMCNPDDAS